MSGQEHRSAIRVDQRLAVEFSSGCPPIQAFVEDLSETGMCIDVYESMPTGEVLDFSLSLPDGEADTPIEGKARVVWSAPTGMGVEFTELGDDARERIRYFVAAVHFGQPPDLPAS